MPNSACNDDFYEQGTPGESCYDGGTCCGTDGSGLNCSDYNVCLKERDVNFIMDLIEQNPTFASFVALHSNENGLFYSDAPWTTWRKCYTTSSNATERYQCLEALDFNNYPEFEISYIPQPSANLTTLETFNLRGQQLNNNSSPIGMVGPPIPNQDNNANSSNWFYYLRNIDLRDNQISELGGNSLHDYCDLFYSNHSATEVLLDGNKFCNSYVIGWGTSSSECIESGGWGTQDQSECITTGDGENWIYGVYGCNVPDITTNYNPSAQYCDDLTSGLDSTCCDWIYGCNYNGAVNYNVYAAFCADGTTGLDSTCCDFGSLAGCMDPTACNYNPDALTTGGYQCEYPLICCLDNNTDTMCDEPLQIYTDELNFQTFYDGRACGTGTEYGADEMEQICSDLCEDEGMSFYDYSCPGGGIPDTDNSLLSCVCERLTPLGYSQGTCEYASCDGIGGNYIEKTDSNSVYVDGCFYVEAVNYYCCVDTSGDGFCNSNPSDEEDGFFINTICEEHEYCFDTLGIDTNCLLGTTNEDCCRYHPPVFGNDDGSCQFTEGSIIEGCTDPTADNYLR